MNIGSGPGNKEYVYDMRLEVVLEDGTEEVSIHEVFAELLRRMADAADFPIEIRDIKNNSVTDLNLPEGETFRNNFSVEFVEAKKRKILLGFKLKSQTPMSVLKHRMFAFLRGNKLFLRIHTGGYQHGVNSILLGYLCEENPATANTQKWIEVIQQELNAVWRNTTTITDAARKKVPKTARKNSQDRLQGPK